MDKTNVKSFLLDEANRAKALAQLKSGKSLFGKDGAFAPILQELLEAALEGELAGHFSAQQASDVPLFNRRNGHSVKQLKDQPRHRGAIYPARPCGHL